MPVCMCDSTVCRALAALSRQPEPQLNRRRKYRKIIRELDRRRPCPEHVPDVDEPVEFELDDGTIVAGRVAERTNRRLRGGGWMVRCEGELEDGSVASRWLHSSSFHSVPARFVSAVKGHVVAEWEASRGTRPS